MHYKTHQSACDSHVNPTYVLPNARVRFRQPSSESFLIKCALCYHMSTNQMMVLGGLFTIPAIGLEQDELECTLKM